MRERTRAVLAGVLAFGAVCALAGFAALVPSSAARAAPAPEFTLAFDGLAPGAPQSRSATFVLERDATLTGVMWLDREGLLADAALDVRVCDAAGTCASPPADALTALAGGLVEVTVTAELPQPPPGSTPAATGSATGRLTFSAQDPAGNAAGGLSTTARGGLAATGGDVAVGLAVLGALLAGGALLVALGRRTHPSPAPSPDAPPPPLS